MGINRLIKIFMNIDYRESALIYRVVRQKRNAHTKGGLETILTLMKNSRLRHCEPSS